MSRVGTRGRLVEAAGHRGDVECLVEVSLGYLALAFTNETERNGCFAHRHAFSNGLLGDLRGVFVADVLVQRGHHGWGGLSQEACTLLVDGEVVDHLVYHHAGGVGEQADRFEQVGGHDWDADVELERAVGRGQRDGRVVTDDLRAHHGRGLANHWVDLARHDGGAWLKVWDVQLAQAGVRAGTHPAQIVVDLQQRVGYVA